MGKGFNSTVIEVKNAILNDVNRALSDGIPITVVQLILEALLNDTKNLVAKAVADENEADNDAPSEEDSECER